MKKLLLLIVLFTISHLMADSISMETPVGNFEMQVEESSTNSVSTEAIDKIAEKIEILEQKYLIKLNKLDQKRATKLTNEIYELLASMDGNSTITTSSSTLSNSAETTTKVNFSVNVNEGNFNETVVEVEDETNSAMSNSDFSQLIKNIKGESFADDQLTVIRMAAKRSYFSIAQLVQIVGIITFADDQVSAVEIVAPKIIDMQNSHNLLNAFTFSDDKDKVSNIIDQY